MNDRISNFLAGQHLTWFLKCPHCNSTGMDLQIHKKEKLKVTLPDAIRTYQRMKCMVCGKLFVYWYETQRRRGRQLKLPEIDSVERVEPLSETEKLARWMEV